MEALKKNHKKIITLKQAEKTVILLVFVFFFEFLFFPAPLLAGQIDENGENIQKQGIVPNQDEINQETDFNNIEFNGKLPESNGARIKFSKYVIITAYNSDIRQTDDSPCVTANNFNVCESGVEDTIASNFLPFGAKVKIPALFGDKVFIVRDRMNKKFSNRIDIWMLEKPAAVNFGAKIAKIEVLK